MNDIVTGEHLTVSLKWQKWFATFMFSFPAVGIVGWVLFDAAYGQAVSYGAGSDIWEHVTVLKSWSENIMAPVHPHMGTTSGSPRFTPLYLIYALIAQMTPWSILNIYFGSAVFHACLFLGGLYLFSRLYFQNMWAPGVAVLILFSLWGQGWGWSNSYELRSFILVAGYPSTASYGFMFLSFSGLLWAFRTHADGHTIGQGVMIAIALCLSILVHPLTGSFAVVGCCVLILEHGWGDKVRLLRYAVPMVGAAVLVLIWPWFSVFQVVFGNQMQLQVNPVDFLSRHGTRWLSQMSEVGRGVYFYDLSQLWLRAHWGLAGGLALIFCVFYRPYRGLGVIGGIMLIPYLINMVFPVALGHRFFFFAYMCGHFALVGVIIYLLEAARLKPAFRFLLIGLVTLFLGNQVVERVVSVAKDYTRKVQIKPASEQSNSPVVQRYLALSQVLAEDAIILSDRKTSFGLPAFVGKVVSPQRGDNFEPTRGSRMRAVAAFFGSGVDQDIRRRILQEYQVTHIIIRKKDMTPEIEAFCNQIAVRQNVATDDYVYQVKRNSL